MIYDPITAHSSASATISFNGKSFTSDVSGNTSKVIPWGTFTFSDSVSGQSFERTIDRNTTDLYVMPEGALYWYGNECTEVTGGFTDEYYYKSAGVSGNGGFVKNTNCLYSEINNVTASKSIGIKNKIDFTNYTKLCVKSYVKNKNGNGNSGYGVTSSNYIQYNDSNMKVLPYNQSAETYLDVSDYNGEYNIIIGSMAFYTAIIQKTEITAIWLE